jgi:hypothetical protein
MTDKENRIALWFPFLFINELLFVHFILLELKKYINKQITLTLSTNSCIKMRYNYIMNFKEVKIECIIWKISMNMDMTMYKRSISQYNKY